MRRMIVPPRSEGERTLPSLRTGLPLFAGLFAVAVALSAGLAYAGSALGRSAGATVLLTGSISGTLTDQGTGLPIASANVSAIGDTGNS